MGNGVSYKCAKCGYSAEALFGVGMAYPLLRSEITESIFGGVFGEAPRELLSSDCRLHIDARRALFSCPQCKDYFTVERVCINNESYLGSAGGNQDFAGCSAQCEDRESVLDYSSSCSAKLILDTHCEICGSKMDLISTSILEELSCPKCASIMEITTTINWD